jgi:hypothetical protein
MRQRSPRLTGFNSAMVKGPPFRRLASAADVASFKTWHGEILFRRAAHRLRIQLLCSTVARGSILLVGVGHNQTGIHCKALSANQTGRVHEPTTRSKTLRKMPLVEPIIARTRERRMVRYLILDLQPAKLAIGKVHSHIPAQRTLRADRKHLADNEHPDHQHRIDRGTAKRRIVRCQLGVHPTQIKNGSNLAYRMIVRYRVVEAE